MLRDLQAAIHGGLVLPGDEDSTSLKSLRSILQSTLTALSGGWFRRCDQVQCAIQIHGPRLTLEFAKLCIIVTYTSPLAGGKPFADKANLAVSSPGGLAWARESLCRGLRSRWFTERLHRNALVTHFQHGQVFCTARQLKNYAVTRCRLHQRAPQR
jgi:hypothetical protein